MTDTVAAPASATPGPATEASIEAALAALGLGTSKVGDYATPLAKTYTGWAAPLGWPSGRGS